MPLTKPRSLSTYVVAVSIAGMSLLAWLVATRIGELDATSALFWILAICVVLGEMTPIEFAHREDVLVVTVSGTFAVALLLTHGLIGCLVPLVIACLIDDLYHRKSKWRPHRSAFNIGQYTLAVAAAAAVLESTSELPHLTGQGYFQASELPSIALTGFVFFAVNWCLSGLRLALTDRTELQDALKKSIGLESITDGLLLALAPIVVAAADETPLLIPLLWLPMFAAYRSARVSVHNMQLANELRAQADTNRLLALHDTLTGLPNRALFHERVGQAILTSRRQGNGLAVMLMDLDRFKEINDALGHHNGDRLLVEIAHRLRGVIRESDTIARLGGDEFAILLPHLDTPESASVAVHTLLAAFEDPFQLEELTLKVEASIGLAFFPEHGLDAGTLMRHADVAMYAAKERRTGYQVYQSDKDEHTRDRLELVEQLRHSIDRGDFVLHYQPKIDLRTRRVVGVEALLRWYHDGALVSPDVFIPLAEHTGLIRPMTMWVVEAAARQCREWKEAGINLAVAVNLSMRNLFDLELPEQIREVLEKWNVSADMLELEITESSIAADPIRSAKVLAELNKMGISLSVDDFGTGHSSLSRIKRLPVQELKIDKSFVMNMDADDNDTAIVRTIIDLAHNLGLRVVAEGVESDVVLRKLSTLGCDVAQGFYIGQPLSATELAHWHHVQRRALIDSGREKVARAATAQVPFDFGFVVQ